MRRLGLALLVLLVGSASLPAQSSWADKMFKEHEHDFGNVPRGSQMLHRFTITNIYAVKLDLTDVRVSCGCSTATPSTRTLEPRQSGTIDILMDARKFTGPKTVRVSVTVGPQFISTAELVVKANSRPDIVFNPGVVDFGVVARGQTPTQTMDVEYAGTLDWRALEIAANNAPVETTLREVYRRPGQVGYQIQVKLKADAPAGPIKHELQLKTNDPASPLVPVLVEAVVQAPLSVVPSSVSIGVMKKGEAVVRRIQVRGNKPFRITAIEGLGNGITAELPTTPALVQTVTLRCDPTEVGAFQRKLSIKTDQDQELTLSATIEGVVQP